MAKQICVVHVQDDYKVSLNVGSKDGICKGNTFLIYTLSDHEIIDPISKEPLGFLEFVKGTGTVIHVQENMCTIESNKYENSLPKKTIRKNAGTSLIAALNGASTTEETIIEREHIPFEDPEVGDFAKRI